VFDARHTGFDILVVAGSHGSLQPLRDVLAALPAAFPAAVVVVMHRAAHTPDLLPKVLAQRCALPVHAVADDVDLLAGTIHIADAAVDLAVVQPGRLEARAVQREPLRTSGDLLFASAADAYGARTLAVVLSGRLSDGATGVRRVKAAGGRVLVQAPDEAHADQMPAAALATGCVDFALPARGLAAAVTSLVMVPGAPELFRVRAPAGIPLRA
jgi:two-component system chemotaxis response regulator CheB